MKLSSAPVYSAFSLVYDRTMEEVPHENWAYYIQQKFHDAKFTRKSKVLDIGAGTGLVAEVIANYFNLIILDQSRDMLVKGLFKTNFRALQAKMESLPLNNSSMDAAYSTHDCINYLTSEKMVTDHLKEVHRILRKKGLYIFDFSTEYNVQKNFHNKTFEEWHDNVKMKWSNRYNSEKKIITSIIDVFVYPEALWERVFYWKIKKVREVHIQKIFSEEVMEALCQKAGFKILDKTYDYKYYPNQKKAHLVVFTLQKN